MQEFAVLSSLCEGNANKVIARALELSEPTVKFHLQNIYRKLGVNSRKLAVELASHYGLVSEQ
jgi:LuxR family maltose regulon positive regulatory protein